MPVLQKYKSSLGLKTCRKYKANHQFEPVSETGLVFMK